MKSQITFSLLLVGASLANAQVVTLQCLGTNAAGTKQVVTVQFNEAQGWVKDNSIMTIRDGVSPDFLVGMLVTVNRRTGEYHTTRSTSPDELYKGKCQKAERKF